MFVVVVADDDAVAVELVSVVAVDNAVDDAELVPQWLIWRHEEDDGAEQSVPPPTQRVVESIVVPEHSVRMTPLLLSPHRAMWMTRNIRIRTLNDCGDLRSPWWTWSVMMVEDEGTSLVYVVDYSVYLPHYYS